MRKYKTKHIVSYFFGNELEFNEDKTGHGDSLVEVFNSLKHDGCLREGYKFAHYANFVLDGGDIPPSSPQVRNKSSELPVTVNPERWVFIPLVKIDKLFMDAIIVNED